MYVYVQFSMDAQPACPVMQLVATCATGCPNLFFKLPSCGAVVQWDKPSGCTTMQVAKGICKPVTPSITTYRSTASRY